MAWYTLTRAEIDGFKRSWPCHGLPDNLETLSFEYASNGDLVDIEATNDELQPLDSSDFDGPALVALSQDAISKGVRS